MRKKEQEEKKNLETSDLERNIKNDQFKLLPFTETLR